MHSVAGRTLLKANSVQLFSAVIHGDGNAVAEGVNASVSRACVGRLSFDDPNAF